MIGLTTVPTARRGPGIKAVISSAVATKVAAIKAAAAQVVAIKAAPSAEIISAPMTARVETAGTATDPTEATQLVLAPIGAARQVIAQPAELIAVRRARVTALIVARSATVTRPHPGDRPTAVLDATMGVQIAAVPQIAHRADVTTVGRIRVSVVTIRGEIALVVTIRAVVGFVPTAGATTRAAAALVVTIPVAVASVVTIPAVVRLVVMTPAEVRRVVMTLVGVASVVMIPAVVDRVVMTPVVVVSAARTRAPSAAITGATAHTATIVATESVVMTVVPITVARTIAGPADVLMTAGLTLGVTTDVAPMIVAPATTGALGMRRRVHAPRRRRFRTNSIPKCLTGQF